MDKIKKLRRTLHVERANRVDLESNIEVLRSLLLGEQSSAPTTPVQVAQLLLVVMMNGRRARRLASRYRKALEGASLSVEELRGEDVAGLLLRLVGANLPGFTGWLIERRPDLDRAIREAYAAQAPLRAESGVDDDFLPG